MCAVIVVVIVVRDRALRNGYRNAYVRTVYMRMRTLPYRVCDVWSMRWSMPCARCTHGVYGGIGKRFVVVPDRAVYMYE